MALICYPHHNRHWCTLQRAIFTDRPPLSAKKKDRRGKFFTFPHHPSIVGGKWNGIQVLLTPVVVVVANKYLEFLPFALMQRRRDSFSLQFAMHSKYRFGAKIFKTSSIALNCDEFFQYYVRSVFFLSLCVLLLLNAWKWMQYAVGPTTKIRERGFFPASLHANFSLSRIGSI